MGTILEEQSIRPKSAKIDVMSLPLIPIPADDKSNTASLLRKMDTEAVERGKSGWLELMIEQSPDMADIFKRMVKSELAAKKAGHRMPGCEQCEAMPAAS